MLKWEKGELGGGNDGPLWFLLRRRNSGNNLRGSQRESCYTANSSTLTFAWHTRSRWLASTSELLLQARQSLNIIDHSWFLRSCMIRSNMKHVPKSRAALVALCKAEMSSRNMTSPLLSSACGLGWNGRGRGARQGSSFSPHSEPLQSWITELEKQLIALSSWACAKYSLH